MDDFVGVTEPNCIFSSTGDGNIGVFKPIEWNK